MRHHPSWLLRSGYESRPKRIVSPLLFCCVVAAAQRLRIETTASTNSTVPFRSRGCCAAATNRDLDSLPDSVHSLSWLLRSGYESRQVLPCTLAISDSRGCCAAATNRDLRIVAFSSFSHVVAAAQRLRIETALLLLHTTLEPSWLLRSGYESRPSSATTSGRLKKSWLLRSGYESRPNAAIANAIIIPVVAAAQRLRIETLRPSDRFHCAPVVAAAQRLRIETVRLSHDF